MTDDQALAAAQTMLAHAQAMLACTALMLAQAMVAEADLEYPTDHAAIGWALKRQADRRGVPLEQQIQEYVSAQKPTHAPTPRTRWVLELDATGARPPSFPARLLWDECNGARCVSRRELWRRTLVLAEDVIMERVPDPCGADDWGGMRLEADRERAERAVTEGRWERVHCGTLNAMFRIVRPRSLDRGPVLDARTAAGGNR